MKVLLTILGAVVFLLCFCSCIDTETSIEMEEGGGGNITMVYSVSKLVMDLGQLDDEDPFSPLPLSEEDFLATAAMVPGLEVRSVRVQEDEKNVTVEAQCVFDSVEDLSAFLSPDRENDPSLGEENGEFVFRYTLFSAGEEEISPESMNMIESFFADDEILLVMQTPEEIVSANRGNISNNGRQVSYSVSIPEIFTQNEDIVWEVRW